MRLLKFIIFSLILCLFIMCGYESNIGEIIYIYPCAYMEATKWIPYGLRIFFIYDEYFYLNPGNKQGIPNEKAHGDAICSIDSDGNNFNILEMDDNYFWDIGSFDISPDGNNIVFEAFKVDGTNIDEYPSIYKISINGGKINKLFEDNEYKRDYSPVWSPDGDWIYFIRSNDYYKDSSIWKIKSDGKDLTRVNINIGYQIFSIKCSNDGKYILIETINRPIIDEDYHYIIISDIYGTNSWTVLNNNGLCIGRKYPCISPDDRWICFASSELYITPFGGGDPIRVTENGCESIYFWDFAPHWSSDGKWIVFCRNNWGIYKLKVPDEFLPK